MRQLGRARGITAIGALVGLLGLAACGTSADTKVAAPADTAARRHGGRADDDRRRDPAGHRRAHDDGRPGHDRHDDHRGRRCRSRRRRPIPTAPDPAMELGSIQIPKIGVDRALWEGVTLSTLNRGPGHWPGTAMPGQVGNVVIGGHRVSHDKPFRNIDQLVAGDQIVIDLQRRPEHVHRDGREVVTPNDTWVINQTPEHTATLFACHPPGSTKFRYVVFAKLAGT